MKNYLKEILLVFKEHYFVITGFIVVSIALKFITVPFLSLFMMLILMFCLSKTKDYKQGSILSKIFQFVLFFIFLVLFVLLFSIPSTIFLIGYDIFSTTEEIASSPLIQNFIKAGAYISILFIFAPYRIVDANVNVFKAIAYSCSVIINNFVLFLLIVLSVVILNLLAIKVSNSDYYVFLLQIILTVALYKLNVKQSLIKGDKK